MGKRLPCPQGRSNRVGTLGPHCVMRLSKAGAKVASERVLAAVRACELFLASGQWPLAETGSKSSCAQGQCFTITFKYSSLGQKQLVREVIT